VDPITTTLTVSSVYIVTLPSGATGVIEASMTFGDIAIIVLLLFLLFFFVVNVTVWRRQTWKH